MREVHHRALDSQNGSSANEHHTTQSGRTLMSSPLASENGSCASEGGYGSSSERTPERCSHRNRRPQRRREGHKSRSDGRSSGKSDEERRDSGRSSSGSRHRHRSQHHHRQAPFGGEDSKSSQGPPDGDSQAGLEEQGSSISELNTDNSRQYLFQQVYQQNQALASKTGGAAPVTGGAGKAPPREQEGKAASVAESPPPAGPPPPFIAMLSPPLTITTAAVDEKKGSTEVKCVSSSASPGAGDAYSSSSVGGHHLSFTVGRSFMKQSNSRREERFYEVIRPFQKELVRRALARWYRQKKERDEAAAAAGTCAGREGASAAGVSSLGERVSSSEGLDETLAEMEALERTEDSSSQGLAHGRCLLPSSPADAPLWGGSTGASPQDEERANAMAQWWREKPRHYKRGNIVTYETQRKAFSSAATSLTGTPPVAPQPPQQPLQQVPSGEAPNAAASKLPTPRTPSSASKSASAADGANAVPSVVLPPDSVYTENRERALRLLAPFVPLFQGVRRVPMTDLARFLSGATPTPPPSTAVRKDVGGVAQDPVPAPTDADDENSKEAEEAALPFCQMIDLEDVCYGFEHPCVMDMKMGQRQYGMHPSPEKKKKKEYRCEISTSGQYGIRLAGYRCWNEREQTYASMAKRECRMFSLAEVKKAMSTFFQRSRALERKFGEQLEALRVAFAQQSTMQFFTSSLLFVYDAARPLETCRLVMVDFAFTYERKELAQGGDPGASFEYDVGYLKALDTLLALVA